MAIYIQRREFIGALGGALVAWPLVASRAHTPHSNIDMPTVKMTG